MASESFMDHNVRSIDFAESWSRVIGARGQEHVEGTKEKKGEISFAAVDMIALEDARHARLSAGSSAIEIESMDQLTNAMKLGNLSQVTCINLNNKYIGSGHFFLARALGSGQMSALKELRLKGIRLRLARSEAVGNALTAAGKFQSLESIDVSENELGTRGVGALGRAIQSGNLERLKELNLNDTYMRVDEIAILANAFQHGEASVLPNLRELLLDGFHYGLHSPLCYVGLQLLAEALKSGRLDSLQVLAVRNWSYLCTDHDATALASAFDLNNRLTVEVHFDWSSFPDSGRRYEQLRKRNIRHQEILAGLSGSPMVPAGYGKIYLCGSPDVGKTTLSNTLQRTSWQSLWTWERRPHVEARTRGIAVSQFSTNAHKNKKQNPITLLVWDMAGQEDYHLVHNAFFPDLSFSEGKATVFVVTVCNAKSLDEAKQQLQYWLRYIASSCNNITKQLRHVFIVLNTIGGDKKVQEYGQGWKRLLEHQRDKFSGFWDVHTNPFILDLRRRGQVNALKLCLLEHSRNLLEREEVPEICNIIQSSLTIWSEARKEFPVLDWETFVREVEQLSEDWPRQIILSATKYLNEVGVLIYIDKSFPVQWGIPYQRLIVLNPNWFCKEIIGNIFLSEDMINRGSLGDHLFREDVDATTGSISMSDFKRFFKSRWSAKNCEDLIAILLWLGLCYKGKEENVFIPSLIDRNVEPGDPWQFQGAHEDEEEQWVMGFSIEHKKREITLAPMSLWHKFQVELAQTPKFNGEVPDNDFTVGKHFMTFTVEYMNVLVEVSANEDMPTFEKISIFVKPKFRKDNLDIIQRKQCQLNLADDLVDILLGLWNDLCGGVQYVHKVVWPWPISESWRWPVSQSRPVYKPDRNVEVAQVKKWVQMHGMGRKMQWPVGRDSAITEDQLLSRKDKEYVIQSAENDVNVLKQGMREAVILKIYPPELVSGVLVDGIEVDIPPTSTLTQESRVASDGIQEATEETRIILDAVKEVGDKVDMVYKKLFDVEKRLQEGLAKVLNEQNKAFRKLQDTARFFKEDKERTCPNLIFLAERDSGVWATLKEALSATTNVSLRFACEAMYNNYRPHGVEGQKGIDVSTLRPSLRKIAPWLKVSLTILLICAKIGMNLVAPGAGLILPDFKQVQQAKLLLDGISWATGFSKDELDKLMTEETGLDPNDPLWNPRDVYGKSRVAITDLIGKLTPEAYEEKLGLRKVCLEYNDGSLHGVVWICTDCHQKFRKSNLVSEM